MVEDSRKKEKPADAGDDYKPEWETVTEEKTVNSMVPLWQRPKLQGNAGGVQPVLPVSKFGDWEAPLAVITTSAEGTVTFKAMLFIPARAPFDFYTREYEKGLQLYSSGVLIMDKCADLLPDHFRFVKGVVDSPDFSPEHLPRDAPAYPPADHHRRRTLEKKIKAELLQDA